MNLFCACLDSRIAKFNVYNVHTMGDEYMVVSGMPNKIGECNTFNAKKGHLPQTIYLTEDRHVAEIAAMALDLLAGSVVFQIPHKPNSKLHMRMGMHTGPAVGVVAGSKIPKYL